MQINFLDHTIDLEGIMLKFRFFLNWASMTKILCITPSTSVELVSWMSFLYFANDKQGQWMTNPRLLHEVMNPEMINHPSERLFYPFIAEKFYRN